MKPEDTKVGTWYRGKRFRTKEDFIGTMNNDRIVVWISPDRQRVQYDGDAVKTGQRRPIVSMEKFLKWVKEEIPEGNPT